MVLVILTILVVPNAQSPPRHSLCLILASWAILTADVGIAVILNAVSRPMFRVVLAVFGVLYRAKPAKHWNIGYYCGWHCLWRGSFFIWMPALSLYLIWLEVIFSVPVRSNTPIPGYY